MKLGPELEVHTDSWQFGKLAASDLLKQLKQQSRSPRKVFHLQDCYMKKQQQLGYAAMLWCHEEFDINPER